MHIEPRRFGTLRLGLFRVMEGLCRALGGRAFYRRLFLAPGRLVSREEVLHLPHLPPDLDGLVLAQLSDIHAGPFLAAGDLRGMVELLEARRPALVAITGDLCAHAVDEAFGVIDELTSWSAPLGTFVVFGNHDYKQRREGELVERLRARGARVLRNEGVRVAVGDATLAITGLEDLEEGKRIDVDAARACLQPGDVEVMLCHNPRGAPALARAGCVLILSGHSHGGQVNLPLLRKLGPAHPGVRIDLGPTTLIVSRGIGALGLPLRVRARAEVVFVTLRASQG